MFFAVLPKAFLEEPLNVRPRAKGRRDIAVAHDAVIQNADPETLISDPGVVIHVLPAVSGETLIEKADPVDRTAREKGTDEGGDTVQITDPFVSEILLLISDEAFDSRRAYANSVMPVDEIGQDGESVGSGESGIIVHEEDIPSGLLDPKVDIPCVDEGLLALDPEDTREVPGSVLSGAIIDDDDAFMRQIRLMFDNGPDAGLEVGEVR